MHLADERFLASKAMTSVFVYARKMIISKSVTRSGKAELGEEVYVSQ